MSITDQLEAERRIINDATIEGFPDYEVDEEGRIYSTLNWRGHGRRKVSPIETAGGYLKVRLQSPAGSRVNRAVHRLVAQAFLPERPDGSQIRHMNGNKTDNRAANLAWGTAKENAADRETHGRTARGENNGFSKLSEQAVTAIREELSAGRSQQRVARDYGVSQKTIWSIANNKRWNHV